MRNKKIWIITNDALPPSLGGLNRHYFFAKELKQRGYDIRIFTSSSIHNANINQICDKRKYLEKEIDGVTFTYLKTHSCNGSMIARVRNFFEMSGKVKKISKYFKGEKPDIILTSSPNIFTANAGSKLARRLKVPYIFEVRDLWPLSIVEYSSFTNRNPIIWWLYQIEKRNYKKCNALIFTMEGGYQYIKDKKWNRQIDAKKIFHINNGVDLESFQSNLHNFQIKDEDLNSSVFFKVVYAGSMRNVYNISVLIEVSRLLKDKKIVFIFYGDGNQREQLEKYCNEHFINNVKFKGRVDKKFIPFILSNSDLNILHSKQSKVLEYGGSQNKMFDYLAAGKPILSTHHMGYNIIEKGNCGISTEDQTPEKIAEALLKIYYLNIEEYEKICTNAKIMAEKYDYTNLTNQMEKVFDYVLKGKENEIY